MNVMAAAKAFNQKARFENWNQFCDPTLAFSDPTHLQMVEIWRAKTGDRKMPRRSDMSARDLKDFLRNIVVFERVNQEPSRYRWRLIGTNLTGMAGDNTGKMIEDTLPAETLRRWVDCFDMILEGGQPMRFVGRVHLQGREYLDAENLFVPLSNDNDEPTFAMAFCRYTPHRSDNEMSWENQIASIPGGLL
jgi:hypothetical protein